MIGGGAAGIPLALGLADSSLDVVLVEGGGLTADQAGRSVYRVVPGRQLALGTDPSKPWYFGGNTNTWAGNCRPLDESDFEPREWVRYSGWPISRQELRPYYEHAQRMSGLGDFRWYDADQCRPHLAHTTLDVDPAVLDTRMMQICPVPSFAELHRQRLDAAANLHVLLHAQALRLKTNAGGDRVCAVEVAGADGRRSRIEADTVVLAAGGVENARLLLASNDVRSNGLGNDHDLVGRFFMDHLYLDIPLGGWDNGLDLSLYDVDSHLPQAVGGVAVWAQLALSEELMRRERTPGLSLWFLRLPRSSPSVIAMRRISMLGRVPLDPGTDFRLVLTDPAEVSKYLLRRLTERGKAPTEGYVLRVQIEQTPDPENRVRLSSARDAFGQPKPELALRLTEEERQGHERALEVAADELGLNGARIAKQMRLMLRGGRFGFFWHHMGTTRMSDDPTQGVVDADCRVHGVSNLFVAGSSVFPTGGTASPTLTIVALALRLADHIGGRGTQAIP